MPKFCDPPVFKGRPEDIDNFLETIQDTIIMQGHTISTDEQCIIYMSTYFGKGSPCS